MAIYYRAANTSSSPKGNRGPVGTAANQLSQGSSSVSLPEDLHDEISQADDDANASERSGNKSDSNNEDPERENASCVDPEKEDALSVWNYPPRELISCQRSCTNACA